MPKRPIKLRAPRVQSTSRCVELDDGRSQLVIGDSPAEVARIFEERGLHGGGPTWSGLLHALAKLAEPPITGDYEIHDEASEAWVTARDSKILDHFAAMVTKVTTDLVFLTRALDLAEKEGIE